jgi:hypothetical protein
MSRNVTLKILSEYLLDKHYVHVVTQPLSTSGLRWHLHLIFSFKMYNEYHQILIILILYDLRHLRTLLGLV